MPIQALKFEKKFGLPNFSNEVFLFDIIIEEGGLTVEEELTNVKEIAEAQFRANNPNLFPKPVSVVDNAIKTPQQAEQVVKEKTPPRPVVKMKPDAAVMKKYVAAIASGNKEKIKAITDAYDIQIGEYSDKKEADNAIT